MNSTPDRVKQCITSRLELGIDPATIADDQQLFAPADAGGMELDSLAAIEIVVGLSKEFSVQLDDMPREAFQSVGTLSAYLDSMTAGGVARAS